MGSYKMAKAPKAKPAMVKKPLKKAKLK